MTIDERVRWQGSPISQLVNVSTLPTRGRTIIVEPDHDALEQLARELGVESIADLRAEIRITRWQRDGIRLAGPVTANLTQTCVVTLEPFDSPIASQIDALFVPETSRIARKAEQGESHEILIDPHSDDAPEIFTPPELDIGGVVQEFLALAVDPYPRSPGARQMEFEHDTAEGEVEEPSNPFSVLATLKNDAGEET